MSNERETFFTTVGCMDGRVQEPVTNFGRQVFGAKFADTVTEAGLVGKLAQDQVDPEVRESIKKKVVDVSIGKHDSKGIVVHGHQECAGNPVADDKQKDDVRRSVSFVDNLIESKVPVIGVFVARSETGWMAEEIAPQNQLPKD